MFLKNHYLHVIVILVWIGGPVRSRLVSGAPNPYCTLGCHYSRVIITVQLQITRVKQHAHNTHRLVRGQRHYCRVYNTILPNTLNLTYTLKFNVIDGI